MMEANFYPGPSRVYASIPSYLKEAYDKGILSLNHRSDGFMELLELTKVELRNKLLIPADYEIVFTSSATECWEIIAQSLTVKASQHFFNGSFGEKWASYASHITETKLTHFGINDIFPTGDIAAGVDVLCVTQNETSNATQVAMSSLKMLRTENQDKLIAVDVTSSVGGAFLDFSLADVWLASVQKCFGLPAGLGIMILSPKAMEVAGKVNQRGHYNSLTWILENAAKNQTAYTPNVMGIYLLYRTQQAAAGIQTIAQKLADRKSTYEKLVGETEGIDHLVTNEKVRSQTVLALTSGDVIALKGKAKSAGIVLGSGYGPWKGSTFRIANFPAIEDQEVNQLIQFLKTL
ncbi:MAG: phosphoserine aminotransferase [Marinoscillum sp.]|jgi:phosphoserine aminotransferase